MNIESCGQKNPLQREGKSQNQRFTEGLATDYVLVDERSTADLLVWASQFAEGLNYYASDHKLDGNWSDFINNDISTRIALIAVTDTKGLKAKFAELEAEVLASKDAADLLKVFRFIFEMAQQINSWSNQIYGHEKFRGEVKNIVKSRLRRHMRNLVEFVKAGDNAISLNQDITNDLIGFSLDWFEQPESGNIDWATWLGDGYTPPNEQAYGNGSTAEKVLAMLDRLSFTFRGFYEGTYLITNFATAYLQETLENWDQHRPHMALFITFLLLFKNAQTHINQFTGRHLDFYYEEVLKLKEKAAKPDEVHLIFKLAKNVFSHKLEAGTPFSAGKDLLGKELTYLLDKDEIVNTGSVASLSTVYVDNEDNDRLYVAPIANSADGNGKAFPSDMMPAFRPFGKSQLGLGSSDRTMQSAEIGFGIASPILNLAEGQRKIEVKLNFDLNTWKAAATKRVNGINALEPDDKTANQNEKDFIVYLSTKKGWLEVEDSGINITYGNTNNPEIVIAIELDSEALPIIGYNEKIHKAGLNTEDPVLKVIMNNDRTLSPYAALRLLKLKTVDISVEVIGIRSLVVQNDLTVLSAEKTFQPFGPRPVVGSNFYVGNQEAFSKKLDNFQINIEWGNKPSNFPVHYTLYQGTYDISTLVADLSILDRRKWYGLKRQTSGAQDSKVELFADTDFGGSGVLFPPSSANAVKLKVHQLDTGSHVIERQPSLEPFEALSSEVRKGFIRLTLKHDFGHDQFSRIYSRQAIRFGNGLFTSNPAEMALALSQGLEVVNDQGVNKTPPPFPNEAYTPEISAISLDYSSSVSVELVQENATEENYENRVEKIYHFQPFGFEEVHPFTYDAGLLEAVQTPAANEAVMYLLPQFEGEGTLLIGIQDLNLDESNSLSLLFQVMESTASPDVPKPEITWAYRSTNSWEAFTIQEVGADSTNGLVTSGILNFSLPEAASANHTILQSNLHWIRGTVKQDAEGIADVLAVLAQAAKATFNDQGNAPEHLAQALEAELITKLKFKEAEVKSVSQPYASFNGRMVEANENYYIRVSERLRHKDRAITIWDYEAMVLEEFPSVYRVKCLNHTSEKAQIHPGHVYVVVVSNLVNKNAVDPLQPRISVNTLEEITNFLKKKNSPFVKLKVENPSYEEIKVEFKVKFRPEIKDTGFYTKQLDQDLIKYLTPWAYEEGADISFEGRLHGSVILDFVEELPYVDFITDFKMFHIPDPDNLASSMQVTEAIATTPMSILVSAAAHTIHLYTPTTCDG